MSTMLLMIMSSFTILFFTLYHKKENNRNLVSRLRLLFGGDGETRTLAPVTRPTPLAGAPRNQLEYYCIDKQN